ncbi:hypothetical protein [Mucilaginibacter antarcticus]|uniref:hypothetical protein n=1 Tax=Mucilaginibacter antarcticus TaxID=1855725 RepID=UPI0036433841
MQQANVIADASLSYFYGNGKFRDEYWFNAVLLRGYQHLLKVNKNPKYIMAFKKCLDNALKNEKTQKACLMRLNPMVPKKRKI